jgi:hypothetical protein
MPLFTFSLDSFQITQTRSAHKDTDYVIFTVKTSSEGRAESFPVKPLGDLNNGTFNIGFDSADNTIYPDSPVVLNYLIVNSSMDINMVTGALATISEDLADGPPLGLPLFTSALQLVSKQFASQLNPIFKSGSCDGLVAAEQVNLTYEELLSYTARSPYFQQATSHIGAVAPNGCNSKPSAYVTHWSMKQVATVPNVSDPSLLYGSPMEQGTAVYLLAQAGFQSELANGSMGSPTLSVLRQSASSPPTQSTSVPIYLTTGPAR